MTKQAALSTLTAAALHTNHSLMNEKPNTIILRCSWWHLFNKFEFYGLLIDKNKNSNLRFIPNLHSYCLLQLWEQCLGYAMIQFMKIIEEFFGANFGGALFGIDTVIAFLVFLVEASDLWQFTAVFLKRSWVEHEEHNLQMGMKRWNLPSKRLEDRRVLHHRLSLMEKRTNSRRIFGRPSVKIYTGD